jgi:hypothetical protein
VCAIRASASVRAAAAVRNRNAHWRTTPLALDMNRSALGVDALAVDVFRSAPHADPSTSHMNSFAVRATRSSPFVSASRSKISARASKISAHRDLPDARTLRPDARTLRPDARTLRPDARTLHVAAAGVRMAARRPHAWNNLVDNVRSRSVIWSTLSGDVAERLKAAVC